MAALTQRGNLDTRAQDGQLRVGLVALTMALTLAAFLDHAGGRAGGDAQSGAPMLVRALVFLPLFVGAYGILAAFYGTCTICAANGTRQTSLGAEPVADREELSSQRRTALRVVATSAVIAGLATTALVLAT